MNFPTHDDTTSKSNTFGSIKRRLFGSLYWPRSKLKQIFIMIVFIVIMYIIITNLVLQGMIYELCTLNLSSSEQWMNSCRHFQLPCNDLFEPVTLSQINYFENSSIVIVGMIRNHDHTIEALLKQLDNLSCLFKTSAVLIYESNSNDNTPKLLKEWRNRVNIDNKLCHDVLLNNNNKDREPPNIIKELLKPNVDPGLKYKDISRLDKYSAYRNYLLNSAIDLEIEFDYFVPIDLDIYGLDIKRVLEELHTAKQKEISVMCLNGIRRTGYMYDSLAAISFNGDDTIYNENDTTWFYYKEEVERSNIIYKSGEFTPMLSCFGAMAFYNFGDIKNTECRYMTSDDAVSKFPILKSFYYTNKKKGDVGICEHIPFNYCLHHHGKKLVIAKDAYLYYGYNHGK